MTINRLVITAVVAENRPVREVAANYGVSKSWIYLLLDRYHREGEAAFEPLSRRPKTVPTATSAETVDLIVELREKLTATGLDAGPDTMRWHLAHHHGVTVSRATIARYLAKHGLVVPEPKKKPKSSYIRFQAAMPNQTWQSDFTHYRLTRPDGRPGADCEILTWLDDCSRFALSVTAHHRVTGTIVLATFRHSVAEHGIPASTLTDNGMVFTTRLSQGRKGAGTRNALETELRRLGITQRTPPPAIPGPAARSSGSSRPSRNGSAGSPGCRPRSTIYKPSSTPSPRSTTITGPTGPSTTGRPRPRSTPPDPRRPRAPVTATTTPTTGSATTKSTRPERSPGATAARCTPSVSGEPTPEPASSSSPRTLRSGSSTPRPANSSASSCSTHPSATRAPDDHPDPPAKPRTAEPTSIGFGRPRCLETSHQSG